ncbi:TPA: hypothetical protein RFV74_003150 [Klebsiella aerogenes]|nr:hypothetical protein [Klebsiella aerogenes]
MNNELTAALLTIEKCRELSCCPAGVDLQDWVKQLAAENVALKEALWWLYEVVSSDCVFIPDEKYSSVTNAAHVLLDTTATDRIVAGIKADGVLQYAENLDSAADDAERNGYDDSVKFLRSEASAVRLFAAQLREGADK